MSILLSFVLYTKADLYNCQVLHFTGWTFDLNDICPHPFKRLSMLGNVLHIIPTKSNAFRTLMISQQSQPNAVSINELVGNII